MEVTSCGFSSTFHCLVFTSHVPKTDALPTALHSGFFTLVNNLTNIYLADQHISKVLPSITCKAIKLCTWCLWYGTYKRIVASETFLRDPT